MNPTERRLKNELKRKRLEVLNKISEINKKHCVVCPFFEITSRDKCTNCQAYKQLQKLGKELSSVSNNKSKQTKQAQKSLLDTLTVKKYRAMKKTGMLDSEIVIELNTTDYYLKIWKKNNIPENMNCKLGDFTVEEYKILKDQKYKEKDIAVLKNVTVNTLYLWRKKMNLV